MHIIETPIFSRQLASSMSDDEYRVLQNALVSRPDSGDIIRGSGGLRKLRWSISGRGKRGGIRIIYYWQTRHEIILLLFMFPKNKQSDLTPAQMKILKSIVEREFK